jgi:hypothetical protein
MKRVFCSFLHILTLLFQLKTEGKMVAAVHATDRMGYNKGAWQSSFLSVVAFIFLLKSLKLIFLPQLSKIIKIFQFPRAECINDQQRV